MILQKMQSCAGSDEAILSERRELGSGVPQRTGRLQVKRYCFRAHLLANFPIARLDAVQAGSALLCSETNIEPQSNDPDRVQ